MAKNANVSDGTLPTRIGKKTHSETNSFQGHSRPKVIGNITKIKANKIIKRPKIIIGNIEEPKVIKTPKEVKVDDERKRYVSPLTLNYVLRSIYLAALR